MDNPEDCQLCCTTYDEIKRRPRSLPCGHTYCTLCIGHMLKDECLCCPSCRALHPASTVERFPVNVTLERLTRRLKSLENNAPINDGNLRGKLQSHLEDQSRTVKSIIAHCHDVQSERKLASYLKLKSALECMMEKHDQTLEFLTREEARVKEAQKEGAEERRRLKEAEDALKKKGVSTSSEVESQKKEVQAWMEKCHIPSSELTALYEVQEKLTGLMKEAMVLTNEVIATSLPSASRQNNATREPELIININELRRLSQPIRRVVEAGQLVAVQEHQGQQRTASITLNNGILYLHCLKDGPPPNTHTLPVEEVLGSLDTSSTLIFLDLKWGDATRGRVHIRLSPDTALSQQFVLLCTGQRGASYLNTTLLKVVDKGSPGEWVVGGDYELNNGEGGAAMLPISEGTYRSSGKAGSVWAAWGLLDCGRAAQFTITTRDLDYDGQYPNVFGEVESGLEVVKAAVDHSIIREVTVVDCGVVLNR